jgi:hypothetical protein
MARDRDMAIAGSGFSLHSFFLKLNCLSGVGAAISILSHLSIRFLFSWDGLGST